MITPLVKDMTSEELWNIFNRFAFLSAKYDDKDRLTAKLYLEIADNLRFLYYLYVAKEKKAEKKQCKLAS